MSGGKSLNIASKAILISTHLEFSSQQRKKFICQNGSNKRQCQKQILEKRSTLIGCSKSNDYLNQSERVISA